MMEQVRNEPFYFFSVSDSCTKKVKLLYNQFNELISVLYLPGNLLSDI